MAVKGARAELGRVTPNLMVRGGRKAVEFYVRAFGATLLYESALPGGNGIHAHLKVGQSMIMVALRRASGICRIWSRYLCGRRRWQKSSVRTNYEQC
jgi:hypothetical protein